jgi:hypothetical protein
VRWMAEANDKSFAPHFLWPGRGDSRNLALVIPSRAQTAKAAAAQDIGFAIVT